MKVQKITSKNVIESRIDDFKKKRQLDENINKLNLDEPEPLNESYLNDNFKGMWSLNEGNYVVKCKGRKELRHIVETCKKNNISYKWNKTIDESYKYNFTFKLNESENDELKNKKTITEGRVKTNRAEFANLLFDTILQHPDYELIRTDLIGDSIDQPNEVDDAQGIIRILYDDRYYEIKITDITDNKTESLNLKEGYNDYTVGEFKELLNDILNKLNQMDDDEQLNVQPNTYHIGNPFVSIAGKGFIDCAELEDKSQTYYYIELNGEFHDSYQTKEDAIAVATDLAQDDGNKVEVFKDINDGYSSKKVWSNVDHNFDESLKLNEKLDLEALKKLLQDFKDGKFELDTLTIDKDGWVATSESSYAVEDDDSDYDSDLEFKESYNTEDRIKELKEIQKQRKLTDDEAEELAYCENEVGSREAEQKYLNGKDESLKESQPDDKKDGDYKRSWGPEYTEYDGDYLTADEIAYEEYKKGNYTYSEYVAVCQQEEVEPQPRILKLSGKKKEVELNPKKDLNEDLKLLGSLDDYVPSDKAKDLWDKINSEGLVRELNKLLEELYPDGVSITQLDDLLALHGDFIEESLGMNDIDLVDDVSDIENIDFSKTGVEAPDKTEQELEDQEEAEQTLDVENAPVPPVKPNAKKYMSDSTGYDRDDYDEDDSDSFLM